MAGTVAMFLVGGGIVGHGIHALETAQLTVLDGFAQPWFTLFGMLWNAGIGIILGIIVFAGLHVLQSLRKTLAA